MKEVLIDLWAFLSIPNPGKICCFKIYDSFSKKCIKLKAHLAIVAFRACKDSSTPTLAPSPPLPQLHPEKGITKAATVFQQSENH